MPLAARVPLLVVCLLAAALGQKKKGKSDRPGIRAHRHSFQNTLSYDDSLGLWLTSAGTMALRSRVQLLPPVPDRYGMLWHKEPLETNDFKVAFSMTVPTVKEDAAVALWLSPENFTASYNENDISKSATWAENMKTRGLDFLCQKPNFRGFGVVFRGPKFQGGKQSIQAMYNDGSKTWDLEREGSLVDWQSPSWTRVHMRVFGNGAVKIFVVTEEVAEKFQNPADFLSSPVVDLPPGTLPAEQRDSYLGFTGYSGSGAGGEVSIKKMNIRNFDEKRASEGLSPEEEEWRKVLTEEKRYIDQKSQKEAVERLTKLLGEHVDRYDREGERLQERLVQLQERCDRLHVDIGTMTAEAQAWIQETNSFNPSYVKEHIVGIKSLLAKDKDIHDSKLSNVHEVAKQLKAKGGSGEMKSTDKRKVQAVADQARELEMQAARGSSQAHGLFFIICLALAALGCLFLHRMRYYERKHYL